MENFDQFWPFYLEQHARKTTRVIHVVGTIAALVFATICAVRAPSWTPAALAIGDLPAWASHRWIEKNRPATFGHPMWSLRADFRMLWRMVTGRRLDG